MRKIKAQNSHKLPKILSFLLVSLESLFSRKRTKKTQRFSWEFFSKMTLHMIVEDFPLKFYYFFAKNSWLLLVVYGEKLERMKRKWKREGGEKRKERRKRERGENVRCKKKSSCLERKPEMCSKKKKWFNICFYKKVRYEEARQGK